MRTPLTVTIDPKPRETRLLLMEGQDERMRAILGPASEMHRRAPETLLEGLSLWHQRPLSVVLCADVGDDTSPLHLEDALGIGVRNVHFEVEVALRQRRGRPRPRRIAALGDFRDLRQLCLAGVEP